MGNIAYKSIRTNNEYVDLAATLGISFTAGKTYQIQLLNTGTIIIADEKPTEGGFLILDEKPFGYKHTGSKLWLKSTDKRPCVVNISED